MLSTAVRTFAVVMLLATAACVSRESVALVDELSSGMTLAQAAHELGVPETSLRVLWETKLDPTDKRPPYSEKTVEGIGLVCLGQVSDIRLNFYLDQLTSVSCYPKDAGNMAAALKAAGLIESPIEQFEVDRTGVKIHGRREQDRWVVTFTSKALDKEQRAWIARYS